MGQIEYGDYYKFVASAGIALLVAAILLPWMFLREPFDLAIDAAKIAQLTPEAQNIVRERQHHVALSIHYIPPASCGLGVLGLLMISWGLIGWRGRQTIRDKSEELEVEKLSRELEQMSPSEVQAKAREDLESAEEQPAALTVSTNPSAVAAYLAVESKVLERIRACYGASAKILNNQRLSGVEYDAIIRTQGGKRIIVEIKYIRKGFRQGWLAESVSNLVAKVALYGKTFPGDVRGVLLIVLAETHGPSGPNAVAQFEELRQAQPSRVKDIRVHTIEEHRIDAVSCTQLMAILA
jgi:hypothetical protein